MKKVFSKKVAILVLAAGMLGINLGFSNTNAGAKLGAARDITKISLKGTTSSTTQSSATTVVVAVAVAVVAAAVVVAVVTEAVSPVVAEAQQQQIILTAPAAVLVVEGFAASRAAGSTEASLSALD